jgi:hypothetical protein
MSFLFLISLTYGGDPKVGFKFLTPRMSLLLVLPVIFPLRLTKNEIKKLLFAFAIGVIVSCIISVLIVFLKEHLMKMVIFYLIIGLLKKVI